MNLLYVSSPGGGLDTNVRILSSALARAGHQVSILYVDSPNQSDSALDQVAGCQVYRAMLGDRHYYFHRATFGVTNISLLIRSLEYAQALGRTVAKINKKTRLDLIELPEGFVPPRLFGQVPYVMRLHSSAWLCRRMYNEPSPWTDIIEKRWESEALQRASGVSSPSRMVAENISALCQIKSRTIEIIPYSVDIHQFAPSGKRATPQVVLFVGRFEKRKGADVLMRAMPRVWAKNPECEFVFAGSVDRELQKEIVEQPVRTKFLGRLSHVGLVEWYQRAAIFAAPSLWDNSPNTVYEAMACGTPVVATRVGGIPELVEDGVTGLLVPPHNENALADAILTLLDDPTTRERMGRCGREKAVANYSVVKILQQTMAFYENVLSG